MSIVGTPMGIDTAQQSFATFQSSIHGSWMMAQNRADIVDKTDASDVDEEGTSG